MTFSNRLWRAIAHRMGDSPAQAMVWAKVKTQAHGKRHYIRAIALTTPEENAVWRLLLYPQDDYFRFLLGHEYATNPAYAAASLI